MSEVEVLPRDLAPRRLRSEDEAEFEDQIAAFVADAMGDSPMVAAKALAHLAGRIAGIAGGAGPSLSIETLVQTMLAGEQSGRKIHQ